jgi:formylglycine-generating enzyme required for sulfatase activity
VPYDAETPAGVHKKLLTEALLRPRTLNPSISEEAERVIYKAMAKDPLQRYADMGAFAQALEKLGQAALSPALHPQAGVGNETTIDYGSAAQPYSKDEPYRTVSFLETSSAEPQSTWQGMRSDPPQPKPQPPKLMVEQEKKPSGIAGWVWGVFVIAAVVIGVLGLLLANTATHPPATPFPAPKQELGSGETRISQKDGMASVFVPAGEFLMGSTQADAEAAWKECGSGCEKKWFDAEVPQHKVDLDGYWMDKTEVTNVMYQKCVADGTCKEPVGGKASATHTDYYGNSQYANYPVINVDWNQSQAYCQWAGGKLPTEAQWEKAARGTDGRTYPWGEDIDCGRANYGDGKLFGQKCVGDTSEVGKYPSGASPYGALDMAGNAWEWVNDWYADNYYQNSPQKNPTGADSGQYRVLRGGSWYYGSWSVRSAFRLRISPDDWDIGNGFRCVR